MREDEELLKSKMKQGRLEFRAVLFTFSGKCGIMMYDTFWGGNYDETIRCHRVDSPAYPYRFFLRSVIRLRSMEEYV